MSFERAEFITSAPTLDDCPEATFPEICFAGRSNVGKSSLINRLTNKKKLARTSNTPGKTQQMNYYKIDNLLYLVDLPGFGYAQVPEKERKRWGKDIRNYLLNRPTLRMILHLVDIRHEPTTLDEQFFYWMAENKKPFSVLLAKEDKLSTNKRQKAISNVRNILKQMNIDVPILPCSAETGSGIPEIQSLIREFTITDPT